VLSIGISSGVYTGGISRRTRVSPLSSGMVRISVVAISHVVAFSMNPASESVRVSIFQALSCGQRIVSWCCFGK
jgi:hypothetical protein